MKRFLIVALTFLSATSAFAKGNPQYTSLAKVSEVGAFIDKHMTEIVSFTTNAAMTQIPNSHYFLVTTKIEINGENGSAVLTMEDNKLRCFRSITTSTSEEGTTFHLVPEVNCVQGN